MPKSIVVDPKKVRKAGQIQIPPIPGQPAAAMVTEVTNHGSTMPTTRVVAIAPVTVRLRSE